MCGVSSLKRLTTKDGGNAGFAGAKTRLFKKPDKSTAYILSKITLNSYLLFTLFISFLV